MELPAGYKVSVHRPVNDGRLEAGELCVCRDNCLQLGTTGELMHDAVDLVSNI